MKCRVCKGGFTEKTERRNNGYQEEKMGDYFSPKKNSSFGVTRFLHVAYGINFVFWFLSIKILDV